MHYIAEHHVWSQAGKTCSRESRTGKRLVRVPHVREQTARSLFADNQGFPPVLEHARIPRLRV